MSKLLFTKETAWLPHKRWGKKLLSDVMRSIAYLDLCEQMTNKSRSTVRVEFSRNWISPSKVEDVEIYLRWRIEELSQKREPKKEKEVVKPKVNMAEIMAKVDKKMEEPRISTVVRGVSIPEYNPLDDRDTPINKK